MSHKFSHFTMLVVVALFLTHTRQPFSVNIVSAQTETPHTTDERYETFLELMMHQDECALPCWWGFILGEASVEDWINFVRANKFDGLWDREPPLFSSAGDGGGWIQLVFDTEQAYQSNAEIIFAGRQGVLTELEISVRKPENVFKGFSTSDFPLSLPSIFNQMQSIPEFYYRRDTRVSQLTLAILYSDEGVAIEYDLNVLLGGEEVGYPEWEICSVPERISHIQLWLQAPEVEPPITDRFNRFMIQGPDDYVGYAPFDDDFDITAEAFVEHFRQNGDECLIINRER